MLILLASDYLVWELATPQIQEYYNWSLEGNYAGRGTELYNIGDKDLKWRFEHAVD